MTFKTRSRLGQAEPISVIVLVGGVIAIALAVYSYFASQAALATARQQTQIVISQLKFNTMIDELYYYNDTNTGISVYYVSIRRIDTGWARVMFTVVAGEFYRETLLVYGVPDTLKIYSLTSQDGIYGEEDITNSFYIIPSNMVYASVDTPLYSGYTQTLNLYELEATQKPGARGCDILLKVEASKPSNGYPMLLVLTQIGSYYYIVDTYQLGG